jgi:aminopeptidase N
MIRVIITLIIVLCSASSWSQDTEAWCTNNEFRNWWHTNYYDIDITVDTQTTVIKGQVNIKASVIDRSREVLQIDLQEPMQLQKAYFIIEQDTIKPVLLKEGNRYLLSHQQLLNLKQSESFIIHIQFQGAPKRALNAPWDGGLVKNKDAQSNVWIGLACQGIGASVWLPCKQWQGDEPDSIKMQITVPKGLTAISNGRLEIQRDKSNQQSTFIWKTKNSINLYNITFYIGIYKHWHTEYSGLKGLLTLDYYVLPEHFEASVKQFEVVPKMLSCFEDKLGPYPFYDDGYKLVEAPYLGMEHQSAIAYGNAYKMGYAGKDRSNTGVGLLFDFIIVHESAHEWFGNSITTADKADTWVHEGFTTYAETIFAECILGKEKAYAYQIGKKKIIQNDKAPIGNYHACDEGSSDHYDKAAFVLHMIRIIEDDDAIFFNFLREMQQKYQHQIIEGSTIELFINQFFNKNYTPLFDQYLRTPTIPTLEIKKNANGIAYRWQNTVKNFQMPIKVYVDGKAQWIYPTQEWQSINTKHVIKVDNNFLIHQQTIL